MRIIVWRAPRGMRGLLRRLFGGFLLLVGLRELFGKHDRPKK